MRKYYWDWQAYSRHVNKQNRAPQQSGTYPRTASDVQASKILQTGQKSSSVRLS